MIITLNHEEILIALKNYANEIIQLSPNQEISIDLKAGRGENGYSATLDIIPKQAVKPVGAIPRATPTAYSPAVVEVDVEAPEEFEEEVELSAEEEDALIDSVMQAPTKSLFARS